MTDEPEPLDSDVRAMLETALPMTAVPDPLRARILSKVEARIRLLPGGGGQGSEGAGAPQTGLSGPSAWVASHPWIAVSAAFVLGGAAAMGIRGEPQERVVYVERPGEIRAPSPAPRATPSASHDTVSVEALPVAEAPPKPTALATANPSLDTGERLAAESAVLDVARTALAAGDGERALDAVQRHEATFPRGLLTEEREALGIRALLALGRTSEAKGRVALFRTRYPESLFLPAVESALKKGPAAE
jgi:hypothetical protein